MSETVGAAIRRVRRELAEAGIAEAREEARLIVANACCIPASQLITHENSELANDVRDVIGLAISMRRQRVPLQHWIRRTEFHDITLQVGPQALIPRSDSECVVDLALKHLPRSAPARIADLGTGTGCLALALLKARPALTATGIDASAEAVELAVRNAEMLGMAERFTAMAVSWTAWTGWPEADLIISNPPYIASDVIAQLEPEVRDHEPLMALDGGADGLDAYSEIIALGAAQMQPGAWLVLEIGYDQRDAVSDLLETHGFGGLQHRRDLGGNDRAIAARMPR